MQQARSNTWLSFRSAQPSKVAQFSVGDNMLWQLTVIDGLADGRIALHGKVHHGTIDGRTFIQLMTHWFSTDPNDREVRAMWQGVPPRPEPASGDEARAIGDRLRGAWAPPRGSCDPPPRCRAYLPGRACAASA